MYRPKSPTATSKPQNLSPSPQSRRKMNNTKTHIQQQIINTKHRGSVLPHPEDKQKEKDKEKEREKIQKKSPLGKKCIFRNIQVQSFHTIDSFKVKETAINNQTPKFCVKAEQPKCFGQAPRSNPLASSNFFSFGQKCTDKIKTERKKEVSQKEISKSPKEMKKKPTQIPAGPKPKPQANIFQPPSRQRRTNQSYLR